jgi:SOS-response transcriptional repressor LexA
MATGELRAVVERQGRWGKSCLLEVQDDALAMDGVARGDFLVVDRNRMPRRDDALVVIREQGGTNAKSGAVRLRNPSTREKLLLRKLERIGAKISLQPGSSPRRAPYVAQESAGIWGTVVAVMRKFEAA